MQRKKQRKPRSRAKIKENLESRTSRARDDSAFRKRFEVYLSVGEALLKELKEKNGTETSIIHIANLYRQLEGIAKCLNDIENTFPAQPNDIIAMPLHEINAFLDLMTSIRRFLNNIYETSSLLTINNLYINDDNVVFFNPILEGFNYMSTILLMMINRTRYESLEDPQNIDQSASNQIRPHLLEALFLTQHLQSDYYTIMASQNDGDISHLSGVKNHIESRDELIQFQIKLLKNDTREYRAYQLALNAIWEILRDTPNLAKAREHYQMISTILKGLDSLTLCGLNKTLSDLCSMISKSYSDDSLANVVLKRYWIKQILRWCNPSSEKYVGYLNELEDVNSKMTFHYFDSLLTSTEYLTCKPYVDIECDKEGIKLRPTTSKDFLRLTRALKEADIDFVETGDHEIIYDCVNHYVPPRKLLLTLTQFVERSIASKNKLPDYHWLTGLLENTSPDVKIDLSDENEKEDEKIELNEKEIKWQNHLANEAERAFRKSECTKLEITSGSKEKKEKEEEDESYVLKASLSGKRIACYHLSIDEKLEKKVPQEVLANADKIIKTPTRSYGKQGIIFFKNGKGNNRKVNAKLKIGGENVRLFATVEKMYKDDKGYKHYSVNFDYPELKHRK